MYVAVFDCLFYVVLSRLGVSIATVMFVLAVSVWFFRTRLGVSGSVKMLASLTCSVLQTNSRVGTTVNAVNTV